MFPFCVLLPTVASWSDRLTANDTQKCPSKNELVEAANEACASAREIATLMKNAKMADIQSGTQQYFAEYYRDTQVAALKHYVDATAPLLDKSIENLTSDLKRHKTFWPKFVWGMIMESIERFESYFLEEGRHYYWIPSSPNTTFKSLSGETETQLFELLKKRSSSLTSIIVQLLHGETAAQDELMQFNVEFVGSHGVPSELAAEYVEFCKNRTIGIDRKYLDYLNETGAHKTLLAQYKEIFTPGHFSLKYFDSPNREIISAPQPESTWSDRLIATRDCLSSEQLLDFANKLCQKDTLRTLNGGADALNTRLLHPDKLRTTLKAPCDAENKTFREISFECDFTERYSRMPPKQLGEMLFQRVHMSLILQYVEIINEFLQAKDAGDAQTADRLQRVLNSNSSHLQIVGFTKMLGHNQFLNLDVSATVYNLGDMYLTPVFNWEEAILGSRENALQWIYGPMRNVIIANRTAHLLGWATKLVRNETVDAEEMKYFNVENVVSLFMCTDCYHTEPYGDRAELGPYIAQYYVEYCKDHTIGVDRKHLVFLGDPDSHLQLAKLYSTIFSLGSVDLSYCSVTL